MTVRRWCATANPREAIGDRMASVTEHAKAAREAATADEARAHLAEAAGLTRRTAERIRRAVTEHLDQAGADRERVARDSHDLLGLGLAAVALKCDLTARLIGRDDARAREELDALIRLATQTHAEMRKVATGEHILSLPAELTAAGQLLTSTGVAVEIRPATVRLPQHVDVLLATVLREAVTNVLRHARATRCDIHLVPDVGGIRLKVTNDGVLTTANQGGGRGLPNLHARAAAIGGRVVTRTGGTHFDVTVRIPLPVSEPPVARGDPDGVHPVPGP